MSLSTNASNVKKKIPECVIVEAEIGFWRKGDVEVIIL